MNVDEFSKDYLISVIKQQKQGIAKGIYSVCSANYLVLLASMKVARESGRPLLVEATCNQVNQFGGYTGMTPVQFREYVYRLAEEAGISKKQIILGGDHLGPYVWRNETSLSAMAKAKQLIKDYVEAGFTKIHLDASMSCADDTYGKSLDKEVEAERIAALCQIAEEAKRNIGSHVYYVVGTEVPTPGGEVESQDKLSITTVEDVRETISEIQHAFVRYHLEDAWERVIALVVQPGVGFSSSSIFFYDREKTRDLSKFIESYKHLVYEAHSTDYQPRQKLKELVEDHFAILKVGPALTFAMREALFALSFIEDELIQRPDERSKLRERLEQEMLADPKHWEKYYQGSLFEQKLARKYSFSDRSRYYWSKPTLQAAISTLFKNLKKEPAPLTLVDQFLPNQAEKIKLGILSNDPILLVEDKILEVLEDYIYACE
jgi:D-tagatose-1,6-bisphosphate aldolase subunit GatZ/KbaZ